MELLYPCVVSAGNRDSFRAGSPAPVAAPAASGAIPKEWVLEEVLLDGRPCLLDVGNSAVYRQTSPESWPKLVGRVENGKLVPRAASSEAQLFQALDQYLQSEQV